MGNPNGRADVITEKVEKGMTIKPRLDRVMQIGVELKYCEWYSHIAAERGTDCELEFQLDRGIRLWMEFNEIVEEMRRDMTIQVIRACV